MIIHEHTLISPDIFEMEFACNLNKCKGACCVEGEFGAPLAEMELEVIDSQLENIRPYMTHKAKALLDKEGFYEKDIDGDLVTKCLSGRDCIFAINEEGVYKCSIDKAWQDGKSNFRKPISCHLYPIRISQVGEYTALNYDRWDICSPACEMGKSLGMPVYKYLKDALIRNFGEKWYSELEIIAEEYLRSR
jgi:hypothetical protein